MVVNNVCRCLEVQKFSVFRDDIVFIICLARALRMDACKAKAGLAETKQ